MARKPGKKQGKSGRMHREGKRLKLNKRKGTEKIRREPPEFEFGCEVTLVRLALTSFL